MNRSLFGQVSLLSSHNMPEVEQMCDFAVIMSRGRVTAMGTPHELVQRFKCEDLNEVLVCPLESGPP